MRFNIPSVVWVGQKQRVKPKSLEIYDAERLFASVRHRSSVRRLTSIPPYLTTANNNVANTTNDAPVRNCSVGTWRSMVDENAVLTAAEVRDAFA